MPRDRYPTDPDRVRIVNDNFSTDAREEAAHDLMDNWPMGPKELAEGPGEYSIKHYQKVRQIHLGPTDVDKTFSELRDEYGSVGAWMDQTHHTDEPDHRPTGSTMVDDLHSLRDLFDDEEMNLIRIGIAIGERKGCGSKVSAEE